jgi:hypothetical protein
MHREKKSQISDKNIKPYENTAFGVISEEELKQKLSNRMKKRSNSSNDLDEVEQNQSKTLEPKRRSKFFINKKVTANNTSDSNLSGVYGEDFEMGQSSRRNALGAKNGSKSKFVSHDLKEVPEKIVINSSPESQEGKKLQWKSTPEFNDDEKSAENDDGNISIEE